MDPIANMLTSIRNGQMASMEMVKIPYSKIKFEIAKVLARESLIKKVEKKGRGIKRTIEMELRYKEGVPIMSTLKRVSKPGQRIYIKLKDVRPVRNDYGILIISTSKGLMTNREAKKQKLGGEIICKIW